MGCSLGVVISGLLFSLFLGMDGGSLTLYLPLVTAQNERDISGYAPGGARIWESDQARKDKEELRSRAGGREDSPKKAGEEVVSGAAVTGRERSPLGSSGGPKVKIGVPVEYPAASQQSDRFSKGDRKSAVRPGGNPDGQSSFGKGAGFNTYRKEVESPSRFRRFSGSNNSAVSDVEVDSSGQAGFGQGNGPAADDPAAAQLARFEEMRRKNLITEEEYRILRQGVLEKMMKR